MTTPPQWIHQISNTETPTDTNYRYECTKEFVCCSKEFTHLTSAGWALEITPPNPLQLWGQLLGFITTVLKRSKRTHSDIQSQFSKTSTHDSEYWPHALYPPRWTAHKALVHPIELTTLNLCCIFETVFHKRCCMWLSTHYLHTAIGLHLLKRKASPSLISWCLIFLSNGCQSCHLIMSYSRPFTPNVLGVL